MVDYLGSYLDTNDLQSVNKNYKQAVQDIIAQW